ncbi:adenine phosphoribosyltransferase isoform X2 [Hetaerina americana]|uniref:adenine phosphoribosyltransferase isoform X2 n=1 Tax=Hetaerina americana TaxID=62018 RepID=UPI003A7F2823
MDISQEFKDKLEYVKTRVGSYPDFPKPGILFRDIFSVYRDQKAVINLNEVMKHCSNQAIKRGVQAVAALECRGFLFGPQLALDMGVPFVPIRKGGKLPGKIVSVEYELEYGKDTFEVQEDSLLPGKKFLIVDDLLATGVGLNLVDCATTCKTTNTCDCALSKLLVISLKKWVEK